ncbi:MAG TPA: ornithine cyclodeaminase family protein [Terriglobia bacterium]|nr:ornithine cyclodeaminase family protein [Terriglobia bacterium]
MLFLSEDEVQELLPMEKALECVTASFMAQHSGRAVNRSRERIILPEVSLHYMAAGLADSNLVGMKIYTISRAAWRFLVLLYHGSSGELLAILEADHLGRIRTGAASGVATRQMAHPDASRVGVIGTGRQARTQLQAVAQVRKIDAARAFGRDRLRQETFTREMTAELGFPVEPADSAEAAVRFGQIVITATTSSEPVLKGAWLSPGTHVNAIGANMVTRRELDDEALDRSAVIAVDTLEQAREEAGDLIQGFAALRRGWDDVLEIHEIVGGSRPGRTSDQEITLFKSSGIALWDVAAAGYVYQQALESGMGRRATFWGE